MEAITYDIGYIEMYQVVQEEIVEENFTYVESWDSEAQEVAQRIWDAYIQGKNVSTFTDKDVELLDEMVFEALE